VTLPPSVALVGEDTAHAVLLCALLRASIEEAARAEGLGWIIDNLAHDPALLGDENLTALIVGLRYTNSIRGIEGDADPPRIGGRPIKLRGHLGGAPLAPEAQKWRALLVKVLAWEPSVALVAKDTDGDPTKLAGLRQVVAHFEALDPTRVIAIAAPHQDAECWFVAGFDPTDAREADALREVKDELGFDPRERAEGLTAHPNGASTDAKRVLRRLLCLDARSAPLDPHETQTHHGRLLGDLAALRRRGRDTGLTAFLAELGARVVPRLFPGVPGRA
jgi:hypothetical protein